MRLLALAGVPALVAAGAIALPAAAAPTSLHLYSKTVSQTFYDASGAKVTDPSAQPQVGDSFAATAHDYRGTKAKHSKRRVGSDHIVCTITATGGQALCDGQIALRGGMIVADRATVSLADDSSVYPVTGGTGRFAKVSGGTVTAANGGTDLTIKLKY